MLQEDLLSSCKFWVAPWKASVLREDLPSSCKFSKEVQTHQTHVSLFISDTVKLTLRTNLHRQDAASLLAQPGEVVQNVLCSETCLRLREALAVQSRAGLPPHRGQREGANAILKLQDMTLT